MRQHADGFIIVLDSQRERRAANEWALAAIERTRGERPVVLQLNKRDLPTCDAVARFAPLNRWGAPMFESIAPRALGVWEPFEAVALMVARLKEAEAQVRDLLGRSRMH
jgi:hypothetical protein